MTWSQVLHLKNWRQYSFFFLKCCLYRLRLWFSGTILLQWINTFFRWQWPGYACLLEKQLFEPELRLKHHIQTGLSDRGTLPLWVLFHDDSLKPPRTTWLTWWRGWAWDAGDHSDGSVTWSVNLDLQVFLFSQTQNSHCLTCALKHGREL